MGRKKKKTTEETVTKPEYKVQMDTLVAKADRKQGWESKVYHTEYDRIAARLVAAGFTEYNLAATFGISVNALRKWKKDNRTFKAACTGGKLQQARQLVAAAYREAEGYNFTVTKTKTVYNADGTIDKTEVQETEMHQPGNPTLAMFMLCNLSNQLKLEDGEKWNSSHKIDVTKKNLNVNVDAQLVGEQIDKLAGRMLPNEDVKQVEAEVIDVEETDNETT